MTVMTYREAVCKALADELRADEDVIFFGEDVAEAGGVFKVTAGLFEEFGPNRVRDTPISEQAIIGAAQ
jgi:acetoin:2,6-dichlorophenolindophenol oxidoreductase subunit beta